MLDTELKMRKARKEFPGERNSMYKGPGMRDCYSPGTQRKPAEKHTEQTWRVSEAGSSSALQAVLLRTAGATAERHSVSHCEFLEEKVFSDCCMGNRCWEGGVARANVGETVGRVQNRNGGSADGQSG